MKSTPVILWSVGLMASAIGAGATVLSPVNAESDRVWSFVEDFEGLSYYGSTGGGSVTPVANGLGLFGGLAQMSYSVPTGGGVVVYGAAPSGAGSALGSGVPASTGDFPAFGVNGLYADTAHGSAKALGANGRGAVVTIDFAADVQAFGFYGMADVSSLFTVTMFDRNGDLIDVGQEVFGFSDMDFWGWESPVGIDRLEISGDYFVLDQLVIQGGVQPPPPPPPAPVPEVAVVAPMVGAWLIGAELIRRRRR